MIVAVLHRSSSFSFGFATLMNLHTGENSQTRSDLNMERFERPISCFSQFLELNLKFLHKQENLKTNTLKP